MNKTKRDRAAHRANKLRARPLVRLTILLVTVIYLLLHIAFFIAAHVLTVILPWFLTNLARDYLDVHWSTMPLLPFVVPAGLGGSLAAIFWFLSGIWHGLRYNFGPGVGVEYGSPRLRDLVNSVTQEVGAFPFDRVRVTAGTQISTHYLRGRRLLIVGLLALKYLNASELASLVAHECAHHHDGAMTLHGVHHRTTEFMRGFVSQVLDTHEAESAAAPKVSARFEGCLGLVILLVLPLRFLAAGLYAIFARVLGAFTSDRNAEFYCDRIAAETVGPSPAKAALRILSDLSIAQRSPATATAEGVEWVRVVDDEYQRVRELDIRYQDDNLSSSTHPSLAERLSHIDSFVDSTPPSFACRRSPLNALRQSMNSGVDYLPGPAQQKGAVANTWLLLTNPDAAQSVLRPLCLLPGLAAEPHVRRAAAP